MYICSDCFTTLYSFNEIIAELQTLCNRTIQRTSDNTSNINQQHVQASPKRNSTIGLSKLMGPMNGLSSQSPLAFLKSSKNMFNYVILCAQYKPISIILTPFNNIAFNLHSFCLSDRSFYQKDSAKTRT